jgi:hypothetical protein
MSESPTPSDAPIFTVADDFDALLEQLVAATPSLDALLDELTCDLPSSLDEIIADLESGGVR